MLERWAQVELYRALCTGGAGRWSHLGAYEQPYNTDRPISRKTPHKWADLVCVAPREGTPEALVWIEMKDLGRNVDCWRPNLRRVGMDLAALLHINVESTVTTWRNPPVGVRDKGRRDEWESLADQLPHTRQIAGQIVLAQRTAVETFGEALLRQTWVRSYRAAGGDTDPTIAVADTAHFRIFGVITSTVNTLGGEVAG